MKTPRLAIQLAALGVIAASLILTACGGSSPSNAAANEQSREQQAETKFADFARCLREHGVNAEAVSHSGGGHGLKVSPGSGGPQQFEAAEKACARYRPAPQKANLSPQQKVEQEESVRKFAKCMREHGIKVETSTKGGGVQIAIHARVGEAGAPNPESPSFQTAQKNCSKLLPGGGPKGAPGPGPGPKEASGSGAAKSAGGSEAESAPTAGG